MTLLQQVKDKYYITPSTPHGRIDWAINDFIANHDLSIDDKNKLILATTSDIVNA